MVTTRRVGRWILYGLCGCLLLVVVLRVGVGVYLGTAAGKNMVARQVEQQIGMSVEVMHIRVGLFTTSIGLRVFDPAAPEPSKAEVFVVENADTDVSLFGFATGRVSPTRVNLRGANLMLHVSEDGQVLTTLPKTPEGTGNGDIPAITITSARLIIRQDGRPEFAIENVNVELTASADRLRLSGSIDDPMWSQWTISGEIDRDGNNGSVELSTEDGPLTTDRLSSIPFVPATVWDHIQPNGRGAVALRLWTDSSEEIRYSVAIRPSAAALTLTDADATLTNVSGLITVSESTVSLDGVSAALADGTITASGSCDFGQEPTIAQFRVAARQLDIRQLPPEWNLPRDFEGKLRGNADLTLRIHSDGRIEPEGGGEGAITEVKLLGFPADDIPIRLRRAGDQYEFQQPKNETSDTQPIHAFLQSGESEDEIDFAEQDKKDPPPKKDEQTTLDATIRLRDIELSELLERLNVDLDYKISGKVTAEVSVMVPVGGVTSQAAYQFSGSLTSPALMLEGLTIRELSAQVTYQNGVLTLTDLSGKVDQPAKSNLPPGTFRGTFTAHITPPGEVVAEFTINHIPVGVVFRALPDFNMDVLGTVAGKVTINVPYEQLFEPAEWSGSGELTSSELIVEGRSAKDIRFRANVANGVVSLKEAKLELEGIPVRAEGTLTLADKYPFTATVRTTGTDVTDLRKLIPEAELPAQVEGVLETESTVKGTASPLSFTASGTIKATRLTLAKSKANHIDVKWELTREKLVISQLKAEAFGGSVAGSADIPLAEDKGGKFDLTFKNFDAAAASELVPDFPVKIAGQVSGKIGGTIAPAKDGESRVGTLDVDLTAPKLTVQGIPAEKLAGQSTIRQGVLHYELTGTTLGGTFEIKGRYPGQKKDAPKAGDPQSGSFRLRGADLSRIAPDVGFRSLAPLRGLLDVSFDFADDFSTGSGRVRMSGLWWDDAQLAPEITGSLLLRNGVLHLSEFTGRLAGGELRARARLRLDDTRRNSFVVSFHGAQAKTLLAPLTDAAGLIDGPLTLVVHGSLGSETVGSGTLTLTRGTVSGVPVTDLRIPFQFAAAPGGYGELTVREASLRAGSGSARGELTLNWGTEMRVRGQIRFTDVPLRTISAELGEFSLLGNGRITGRFDLGGTNVRSADDLTGTLIATLNNTSVREIPIIQQITPFVNPSGLVRPFQAGDVRASLSRGVFRVQRLALANPTAQLFAEGTITTAGRVDLNVVAHTGAIGPETRAARLFGLRIPAFGPLPITLIRDVSDFLSNRTIRLSITGTTGNPIVRVNVGALLTEQAMRFLLNRYVIPAETAGALGVGSSFPR